MQLPRRESVYVECVMLPGSAGGVFPIIACGDGGRIVKRCKVPSVDVCARVRVWMAGNDVCGI